MVYLPFSDRFLEFQMFSNVFILSSLSLKFRSTISFLSLENQMPNVLNGPFFILICFNVHGILGSLRMFIPIGIISVFSKLSFNPDIF